MEGNHGKKRVENWASDNFIAVVVRVGEEKECEGSPPQNSGHVAYQWIVGCEFYTAFSSTSLMAGQLVLLNY